MKSTFVLLTFVLGLNAFGQMNGYSSEYTTVDLRKCSQFTEGEGGDSAICQGPNAISLDIAVGDWTHMHIVYQGLKFSTWEQMGRVGSFTSLGGNNQVVEWISKDGKVKSLIARGNGVNPSTQENYTSLLVYGFNEKSVCYRGRVSTNEQARLLAMSETCIEPLKVESTTDDIPDFSATKL